METHELREMIAAKLGIEHIGNGAGITIEVRTHSQGRPDGKIYNLSIAKLAGIVNEAEERAALKATGPDSPISARIRDLEAEIAQLRDRLSSVDDDPFSRPKPQMYAVTIPDSALRSSEIVDINKGANPTLTRLDAIEQRIGDYDVLIAHVAQLSRILETAPAAQGGEGAAS